MVCNPLYTAYITTPQQDRLTVLSVLRNLREPVYQVNDEALSFLQQCGDECGGDRTGEPDSVGRGSERGGMAAPGQAARRFFEGRHRRYIQEAAAVAAYHAAVGCPVVRLLVVDEARQFKLLTEERGLCWVHEGRHFKQLEPRFAPASADGGGFPPTILGLLPGVAGLPPGAGQPEAERLSGAFDQLFSS